jgi:uncharacterized protein YndB with AHSA1/START domain
MKLETRASVEIDRPPDVVFDVATDAASMPRFLLARAPIPGVVAVEMEGPARAGARRRVSLSDGSVMGEEITVLDRDAGAYGYRWLDRPPAPFSLLVRGAEARWTFSAAGAGTRIDWVYALELTSRLACPPALVARWLFRRWMAAGLATLRGLVDGEPRA